MTESKRDEETLLVHAYLDGELGPADAIALERRMMEQPALAAERRRIEALRITLREQLPPVEAPPALRRRIEASLGSRRMASRPTWSAMAASVALGAFIASGSTLALLRVQPHDTFAENIVASHMRGLMASEPTDVTSSDRHTVKPWFNGRIAQAPRVVDLNAEGFPLVGGRLDVVGRKPVPTLVYRRRQHVISLTAIRSEESSPPSPQAAIDGYNLEVWRDNGTTYWATSDLNPRELAQFATAFRSAQ